MPEPTIEDLRAAFRYDPETGRLTWAVGSKNGHMKTGDRTGYVNYYGYRTIGFQGSRIVEHRIIFAIVHGRWPVHQVDHVNGIRDDNRLSNLREATPSQNSMNTRAHRDNKSGFKGVTWLAKHRKWRAEITKEGKRYSLGYFDTPEAAHNAYTDAAKKNHGEFARW